LKPCPSGTCYPDAYRLFRELKNKGEEAHLVHGSVKPSVKRFLHAWVEHNFKVYPSGMDVDKYRKLMNAREHQRYEDLTEVQIKLAKSGHYGPWRTLREHFFTKGVKIRIIDPPIEKFAEIEAIAKSREGYHAGGGTKGVEHEDFSFPTDEQAKDFQFAIAKIGLRSTTAK